MQSALDAILKELREILHRRGRLSSRNEALDELSKLLFAHIISIRMDHRSGISKGRILRQARGVEGGAESLREFVGDVFARHLPSSLAHEMKAADFELRLKPQEDALAIEIIECFERLTAMIESSGASEVYDVDLLNDVFGKFLAGSFADEKELGQYLTPTEVVDFMVQLAIEDMSEPELATLCDPYRCSQFGLILDPSCGVGSFLTSLLKALRRKVEHRYGTEVALQWVENMVSEVVTGIDKSERMVRLALASMAMFGMPAARLHVANSLLRSGADAKVTASFDGRVNLILTNPPFGAEFGGTDLSEYKIATTWAQRSPAKVNSEILFMERYCDWLAPGGRLLAIVPDSILTNKGLFEDLRRHLQDKIDIRSVVSLPPVTFGTTGTTTKTSIL
jgi:type I restriction-modification system DNA methylase subunit